MEFANIEEIIKNGADVIIKEYQNLKKLKNIPNPEVYHFSGYNKKRLNELQGKFDKSWTNVIYIFSAEKLPAICSNVEKIKAKFAEINAKSKCMPKINRNNWGETNQYIHYLYVGSCKAKPNERMSEHLCNSANTTYALHLKEWWIGEEEFNVDVFVFGESLSNGNLQIIEDLIWKHFKPLFGRLGHK
ncbi:hypothetical protein AGMMS50293_21590 [Spirochaetia bacterium]|nr:hypothetical protein AGMMS50293_21590 [Spirochaetia bacterium]